MQPFNHILREVKTHLFQKGSTFSDKPIYHNEARDPFEGMNIPTPTSPIPSPLLCPPPPPPPAILWSLHKWKQHSVPLSFSNYLFLSHSYLSITVLASNLKDSFPIPTAFSVRSKIFTQLFCFLNGTAVSQALYGQRLLLLYSPFSTFSSMLSTE